MWQEINYKEDSNDLLIPNVLIKLILEVDSIEDNSIAQEIGFESEIQLLVLTGKNQGI